MTMDIPKKRTRDPRRLVVAGAVAAVVLVAVVILVRMESAAPSVAEEAISVGTVERGDMTRRVRAPGTLVPERVRWISSVTAGRIERIEAEPGEEVGPGTVLMELSNPDVLVEALQAERALTDAEAELVNTRIRLNNEILNQRATVAEVEADFLDARRTADNNGPLVDMGLIAQPEYESSRERAEALSERLEAERERLEQEEGAMDERLEAQRAQVERLRSVAEFQRDRVESMVVRAGVEGVVVELPGQEGQWVGPGEELARIVQPGPLKAELRVPEARAPEIAVGQPATVDTRSDLLEGQISRMDPAAEEGTVRVDVQFDEDLPSSARPNLGVDGRVELERLEDVLHVPMPVNARAESAVEVFRLDEDGRTARRTTVRLGRSSVNTVEVMEGLQEGDRVILSDISRWDGHDRIRIR